MLTCLIFKKVFHQFVEFSGVPQVEIVFTLWHQVQSEGETKKLIISM